MSKRSPKLTPKFKLWLSSAKEEGVFGDGKWRLLEAIDSEGSLSAAAKALKISYRKAWGDIQKAERCLGLSLVEKRHGGRAGGSAALTARGKAWLNGYTAFRASLEKAAAQAHKKHFAGI